MIILCKCYIVYEDFIEFGTATTKQRQKTQKVQEDKLLVFQKTRKCRIAQTLIEQNNDQTRIMSEIEFCSFLNPIQDELA